MLSSEGETIMNKCEFLECLNTNDDVNVDVIQQLKNEKLPLVMWGIGDVGVAVFEYLNSKGIGIDSIWVDDVQKQKYYQDIAILSLLDITNKYENFNVVLGHSHYELGKELCIKYPQIRNVYYMFSIHYGQYELVNYKDIECIADRYVTLANKLEDTKSVNNLLAYLNTKMTGNNKYIFDVYESEMSFFKNDIYEVTDSEYLLDIGAYDGDTIREFLSKTPGKGYKKIIALEPDDDSFLKLNKYVAQNRMPNVVTSMLGAWNERRDLEFDTGNEQLSSVVDSVENNAQNIMTIYADRIDNLFFEPISLIKINYFKGVLEAIQGCEQIIRNYHPKMAIDVGFDIYNVLLLFEYISSLNLGYKFYLRFNRAMSSTFTLYMV